MRRSWRLGRAPRRPPSSRSSPLPPDAHAIQTDGIEAVGTVEIREHDVAPMTAARVVRLLVDEGAVVDAGDTVAVLSMSTLAADIEQRRARVATAQAALREAEAGPRSAEIDRAEADLRAAEAEAERAARDLVRIEALTESGALAQQQLDVARTAGVDDGKPARRTPRNLASASSGNASRAHRGCARRG